VELNPLSRAASSLSIAAEDDSGLLVKLPFKTGSRNSLDAIHSSSIDLSHARFQSDLVTLDEVSEVVDFNPQPQTVADLMMKPISAFKISTGEFGRLSKLHLEFPFQIQCITMLEDTFFLGGPQGLYHLGTGGKLTSIITGKRFTQIEALPSLGILLALCGTKRPEVRMYSLPEILKVAATSLKPKKFQFYKLKNSGGCTNFCVKNIKNSWFLSLAVKRKVILYLWDYYPHYKFLIVKEWASKDKAVKTQLVTRGENLSQICVMFPRNFEIINVYSGVKTILDFELSPADLPVDVCIAVDDILLFSFTNFGFFVDGNEHFRMATPFDWSLKLQSSVVAREFVITMGDQKVEVMSANNPLNTASVDEDFRSLRFLNVIDNRVYFVARLGSDLSSICSLSFEAHP